MSNKNKWIKGQRFLSPEGYVCLCLKSLPFSTKEGVKHECLVYWEIDKSFSNVYPDWGDAANLWVDIPHTQPQRMLNWLKASSKLFLWRKKQNLKKKI
jgi:hypothetical protein